MSNRELVKPYESESADLSSNIRIFDKLVTNIRRQTPVCQTQTRISGYSSNSNPGFGGRIFDLPFTGANILERNVSESGRSHSWHQKCEWSQYIRPHRFGYSCFKLFKLRRHFQKCSKQTQTEIYNSDEMTEILIPYFKNERSERRESKSHELSELSKPTSSLLYP